MAHEFFHIEPITKEGLNSNKRATQRLWSTLDGVCEKEGGFAQRPAIFSAGASTAVISGNAQMLYEFVHLDRPTVEIIRPDGEGNYTGGSTAWEDQAANSATYDEIDEETADEAVTMILSDYDGAAADKYSFTLANTAATFATVNKVTFHIRARSKKETGSEIIRPTADGYYSEYGADVDETSTKTLWAPYPEGIGGDYYDEVDEVTADDSSTYIVYPGTRDTNRKVSFTMGNISTLFDSISKITVTVKAARSSAWFDDYPTMTVGHRSGGVDYQIGAEVTVTPYALTEYRAYTFEASYNPATGLAWTTAEMNALEIVLRKANSADTMSLYVTQVYVTVEGVVKDSPIQVFSRRAAADTSLGTVTPGEDWETLTIETTEDPATSAAWTAANVNSLEVVVERDEANPLSRPEITQAYATVDGIVGAVRTHSKLYATHSGIKRLNQAMDTFTDIDNAATSPTCGEFDRWDATEFGTYVYFTDGTDDLYLYPDAGDVVGELAAKPVGRTLATYGGVLHQGDVTEGGTRVKWRLRWCNTGDATDWAGGIQGLLDLDETPGAIVKLKNLVERAGAAFIGILVAYKEKGIYHIEATGDAADPFNKRLIDGSTGCYAMSSVQGYVNREGREVHAFLGHENGVLNVYEWNADAAAPIGDPIRAMLDDEINYAQIQNAFAVVSPETNSYVLFVATGNLSWPEVAYVYNISLGQWTRWEVPAVTAAGQWVEDGQIFTVLGKTDALAYKLSYDQLVDGSEATPDAIAQVYETGDLLIGNPEDRIIVHRVWIWYVDRSGGGDITVSVSDDGGYTYDVAKAVTITGTTTDAETLAFADINLNARRPRIKIDASDEGVELDLTAITIEWERQGTR